MSNIYDLDLEVLLLSRGISFFLFLIGFVWFVGIVYSFAYLFEEAGYQRWKAVVPYYNGYILYEMTVGNGWLFLTLLIPILGYISWFIVMYQLGRCFGKGVLFSIGLGLLSNIFIIILAFDKEASYSPKM